MSRLPTLRAAQLVGALERDGWHRAGQRGSHLKLKKGSATIVVPIHRRDLRRGTLAAIIEDAGLTEDRLRELL